MPSLLDPRMIATPQNTYAPTGRDVENLSGGMLSGLAIRVTGLSWGHTGARAVRW
jgi:hypothetical protein